MRTSTGTGGLAPRLVIVLAAATVWLVFAAPTVQAHTVSGAGASNFVTTVTGLSPASPGVELSVVENGARLRLTVSNGRTVYVKGYENDVYLRLDSTGVWENARSSAAYLNDDRYGNTVAPPGVVDASAPPRWTRLRGPDGGRTVAIWHDHRAHWMGENDPPVVRAAPGEPHQIYGWTIDLTVDGTPVTARGTLSWVPGPSGLPWFALALVSGVAVAALGTRRRWGPLTAAATVVLVAADGLHSGLAGAALAEDRLGGFLSGNVIEMALWLLALGAAGLLARRSVPGLYLAASAGFALALVGGIADVSVFYRSSAPVAGPLDLTRAATALTTGVGLGLLGAAAFASRRVSREKLRDKPRDEAITTEWHAGAL